MSILSAIELNSVFITFCTFSTWTLTRFSRESRIKLIYPSRPFVSFLLTPKNLTALLKLATVKNWVIFSPFKTAIITANAPLYKLSSLEISAESEFNCALWYCLIALTASKNTASFFVKSFFVVFPICSHIMWNTSYKIFKHVLSNKTT